MRNILSIITIAAVIIFGAATEPAIAKEEPRTQKRSNHGGITYIATVNQSFTSGLCDSYNVVIKDENGNPVCGSLPYSAGIDTYVFHEKGNISGQRIAHLERTGSRGQVNCSKVLITPEVPLSGNFRNGSSYFFELYPEMRSGHK